LSYKGIMDERLTCDTDKYKFVYRSVVLEQVLQWEVFRAIYERSHFKPGQLDSLIVKVYAARNAMTLKKVIGMRDTTASQGSTERSASQARMVISKSVATLILSLSLGLIEAGVVESIPRIATAVEQSRRQNLTEEEANRLIELIDAIITRSSHR